jgi:ankyrin repeat protein
LCKIPGIDANLGKIYGWTAIILAARYGRNELVQALISIPGININSKNFTGTTALMSAAKYGHAETVKILLNVTDINVTAKDNEGNTAFDLASNDEIKKLLIKTDDDLDNITINYIKK